MNKFLFTLLISSIFIGPIFSMDSSSKPEALSEMTRFSSTKEFKECLEKKSFILNAIRTSLHANTALHEMAYPFTDSELEFYNKKHNTSCNKHDIARIHAYNIDLFLRKNSRADTLLKTNRDHLTSGVLAAEAGYLPAMARIMLSNPPDWALMISYLPVEHKKLLIKIFLEHPSNPKIAIPQDLQVDLTQKQMLLLRAWAQNATPSWPHLDREQTKYLFECFLAFDIYKQYQENPNNTKVKKILNSNNTPPNVVPSNC